MTIPYRVQDTMYSADLLIANLVDIRMPCLQGSVTREVIYRERNKLGKMIYRVHLFLLDEEQKLLFLGRNVFYDVSAFFIPASNEENSHACMDI